MKPITIAGGGLAGLTLGLGLRQRGVPVTLSEAGHYPRHRVCGEFISGRGQETLARLGLRDLLNRAGAVGANTAAFFSATRTTGPRPLPARAICLSRFVMDQLLAEKFRELGGELQEGKRWPPVEVQGLRDREIGSRSDRPAPGGTELQTEGVVRATGRQVQTTANGTRWFGLKAHARNVRLAADLEMHVSPRGYVGLCRVDGGKVNVCGLFRRHADERIDIRGHPDNLAERLLSPHPPPYGCGGQAALSPAGSGREGERPSVRGSSNGMAHELLRGPAGSLLHQRLAAAEFDESSFCAVAGLSLRPRQAAAHAECCIGDAITMTPPVTGNGMSMAFESAELALAPLTAWSRGDISWMEARSQIARDCDAAFAGRLAWAKWLQRFVLTPSLQNALVALAARSDWFWRLAFEKTR